MTTLRVVPSNEKISVQKSSRTMLSLLEDDVPTVKFVDLSHVYSDEESQKKRYAALISAFTKKYSNKPEFICRSPGRVNLIGEHIDYSGFSVLPMAIERDMIIAVSTKKGNSMIVNTNPTYTPKIFTPDTHIEIDDSKNEWSNLFLCGLKGISEGLNLKTVKPMQIMCDGNVPYQFH